MSFFLSVLAVIGTVLKWILFVILGLIGLILLLVIVILSTPIRYRISGEKSEETMSFKARVTYFFSLVRVNVSFEDKKLRYQVKVAWKEIAGSEKERGSDKQTEEFTHHGELEVEPLQKAAEPELIATEKPALIEEVAKEDPIVEEISKEIIAVEENEPVKTEPHIVVYEKETPLQKGVAMMKQGVSIMKMKPEEALEKWQQEKAKKQAERSEKEKQRLEQKAIKEKEKALKQAEKDAKRKQKAEEKARKLEEQQKTKDAKTAEAKPKETLTEKIDHLIDKLFDLLDSLWDLIDTILDAPDKIEETFDEKVAPKLKQVEKYKRLYDKYPRKKETIQVFLKLIQRVLRPLVPKRYEAYVHFGTGDPYMTARILGGYYSVAPMLLTKQNRRQHLEVSTDMMEKVLLFDANTKGHFSINTVLVFPLLRALFNRDTFRLIRFVLKLRKQLKKQKETSSTTQGDKT